MSEKKTGANYRGPGYINPEETRGVGIPYPARTGGRRLAEEMANDGYVQKGDLVNEGITFEPIKEENRSELDEAIEEVFEELTRDENLLDEIEEIIKEQDKDGSLGGLIKEVTGILKTVNKEEKKMSEKKNVNMGQDANAGQARDDSTTSTRLLDKNWSPLVVRKYQMEGWPMFIGIICDANLNDLDNVVYEIWKEAKDLGFVNGTIQGHRNCCGLLSDRLVAHYNKEKQGVMEGNCVFWYTDKLAISSAYGDLMTHNKCAMEFYSILQMMPHI